MYIVRILSILIPILFIGIDTLIDTTTCNFELKNLLPQGNNKASAEQKLCNYKYSGTDNQDFYIWRMPEHDAAISAEFSTVQTQRQVPK